MRLNDWKMKPDPVAAILVLLEFGHLGQVTTFDRDRARGRVVQRPHQVKQRALARSRRPDDERESPLGNPAGNPPKNLDPAVPALERLVDVGHLDHARILGKKRH